MLGKKGADQLQSYHAADLHPCFRISNDVIHLIGSKHTNYKTAFYQSTVHTNNYFYKLERN